MSGRGFGRTRKRTMRPVKAPKKNEPIRKSSHLMIYRRPKINDYKRLKNYTISGIGVFLQYENNIYEICQPINCMFKRYR